MAMAVQTDSKIDLQLPSTQGDQVEAQTSDAQAQAPNTDSMVTIRLSDVDIMAGKGSIVREEEAIKVGWKASPEEQPIELSEPTQTLNGDSSTYQDSSSTMDKHSEDVDHSSRVSSGSSSAPSVEEEARSDLSGAARSRGNSIGTVSSTDESVHVDWEELEKTEEKEQRDEGTDESTAFLLARLEQANHALAVDPKAGISKAIRTRSHSRPPSIHHLKRLVAEPTRPSLRYSMLPSPPPMTELEFWAALVTDYPQTAQRLPTLTSNKIRAGIPAPLRGVVWMSIAGARDVLLETEYEKLCAESSPYENLIGKDIGRSFPGVDMFRDPHGEGQKMLGKVLKCFSLWDPKIGYCQGLGFVVGPLIMHMGDREAFCVLVRLMEHYDLRSCFLPDLSGLHLRIYQFQNLLAQHLPTLTAHLEKLNVEPLYVSQWFLSFFAVTCPLPMLLRIYDVILTDGASETLMRVALSLMRRNEKKIIGCTEFEDVMQLLLSRGLWDTYGCNADDLVNDFVGLTGLVTRESLQALEAGFKASHNEDSTAKTSSLPNLQANASRFLGRFWAGSTQTSKLAPSQALSAPSRPTSMLRRTPSKQSMASTLNSIETIDSIQSTASTIATTMSRESSAEYTPAKTTTSMPAPLVRSFTTSNTDRDLHGQIEDLLTALSDMQREQNLLAGELQKQREERQEDRAVVKRAVDRIKKYVTPDSPPEDHTPPISPDSGESNISQDLGFLTELEDRFTIHDDTRTSTSQTKNQLQEELSKWKEQYNIEAVRSADLSRLLSEQENESARVKEQLRDARSRVQDVQKEKQRIEKLLQDLRSRNSSISETSLDSPSSTSSDFLDSRASLSGGLREFKLGKPVSQPTPMFAKRSSSLCAQAVLATEDHKPAAEDALLLELVNAKTAEALAKQELEEVKGKLDSLRKMLAGGSPSPGGTGHRSSPSEPNMPKNLGSGLSGSPTGVVAKVSQDVPKLANPSGGFFSGWGKRSVSNVTVKAASPEAR